MEVSPSIAKNVLVIGSGGREHALAWKLSQSPHIRYVYVAPGNAGTLTCNRSKVKNVPLLKYDMLDEIVNFAKENEIALVVPGPEACLVSGLSDILRKAGVPCFGPSKMAAQLEGSKAFSKAFMKRHGIPTASFEVFTDYTDALKYVESVTHPIVIKASGLAAGKGVLLPKTREEAVQALQMLMVERVFGDAANEVVIEEYLEGEELSVLAFSDGYTVLPFPSARDHKRIFDHDQGPNTGGMGAYAPASPMYLVSTIQKQVLQPTIDGIRKEGHPFVGVLYAGIMLTKQGPKVLEYNVRMGDPETQVLLPLLKSDLFDVLVACCQGYLDAKQLEFHPGSACTIVLASKGYPGPYGKDIPIHLSGDWSSDVFCFHSGTAVHEQLVTSGGRVLCITGIGATLKEARDKAYQAVEKHVTFPGMQYRKDIAFNLTKASATYADAGVSIDQGDLLVERIKPFAKATRRPGADADLGGFGGLFDLARAGFKPTDVLVAATDGVGTKLKLALEMKKHDTIGIDLVAMNVNDIVVQAAEPLLFLDYFACGKLDVNVTTTVIQGIAEGCKQAGCALVGGETAEMPSMYHGQDYDLAGFSVGAVNPDNVLPKPHLMQAGDVVLGLVSSGIHSNGFSLVRHLTQHLDLHGPCPFAPETTLGEALLTPTRIYVRPLLKVTRLLKGMAHITGGGLVDNIPRMLPESLGVELDARTWPTLPVFSFLRELGNIETDEMLRTFNCGLGMVLVASPENVNALKQAIPEFLVIGKVTLRSHDQPQVLVQNF